MTMPSTATKPRKARSSPKPPARKEPISFDDAVAEVKRKHAEALRRLSKL